MQWTDLQHVQLVVCAHREIAKGIYYIGLFVYYMLFYFAVLKLLCMCVYVCMYNTTLNVSLYCFVVLKPAC